MKVGNSKIKEIPIKCCFYLDFVHRFNGSCWNFETNCLFACTIDYNPICAFDGVLHKTFPNECAMKTYNCPRNIFGEVNNQFIGRVK